LALDIDDQTIPVAGMAEALSAARRLDHGVLNASASDGRSIQLRFDQTRSFVMYMGPDRAIQWPHFPARPDVGPEIRAMFCPCCGILLGHWDELLPLGMGRGEGFRLCAAILASSELPSAVPELISDQPLLPGMESVAEWEAKGRVVEWRVLGPIGEGGPAEPEAPPDRPRD
jgi:hypothetical protein